MIKAINKDKDDDNAFYYFKLQSGEIIPEGTQAYCIRYDNLDLDAVKKEMMNWIDISPFMCEKISKIDIQIKELKITS